MRIPAYQIHNVLQQYTDQLTGAGIGDEGKPGAADLQDDSGFFATVKRREVIGTIAEKIKEKVSRVRLSDRQERKDGPRSAAVFNNGEFTPFEYNVIDKDHRKIKRTIAVTRFYAP